MACIMTLNRQNMAQELTGTNGVLNNIQVENKTILHNSLIIPVVEEQLHIGKKVVETGKVFINKKVTTHEFDAEMPLKKHEIIIERKPVDKFIDGDMPGIRLEGDITIIPVIKEVMVKRLLFVEEIHVIKQQTDIKVPIREILRKEEVTITRTGGPATGEEQ